MKPFATKFGLGTAALTVSLLAASAASRADDIQVNVDGTPVAFGATKPVQINGSVFVPLRGVFQQMGAYVEYDSATRTIRANKQMTEVKLTIGNPRALVNGNVLIMETPPSIIGGATMVPLRFLSQALGADVEWSSRNRMVSIMTNNSGGTGSGNGNATSPAETQTILAYTVIPVTLDDTLSSTESDEGDKFTARVNTGATGVYSGIPEGTKIEGHVRQVKAQSGKEPGVLELAFDRLRLPNGTTVPIDGTPYSLDQKDLATNEDGVMMAKNKKKDNRAAYAGYGAGAGVVVGLLSNGKLSLEKALIGGVLGYIIGSTEKKESKPSNVKLQKGMALGVRLNQDVAIRL